MYFTLQSVWCFVVPIIIVTIFWNSTGIIALPSKGQIGRDFYEVSNSSTPTKPMIDILGHGHRSQLETQSLDKTDNDNENSGESIKSRPHPRPNAHTTNAIDADSDSKSKVTINKCTEDVFIEDYWTLPEWLKGPESDTKTRQLKENGFNNGDPFKFKIRTKPVECSEANFRVYKVQKSEIFRNESYDIDWQYGGYADYFTPFGEFKMNDYFLDHQSYCVATYFEEEVTLEVCIPQIKIRKCCPYGTVVKFSLSSSHELPNCVEILGKDWAPFYYKNGNNDAGGVWNDMDVSYFSEFYNPDCVVYDKLTPNRRASGPYLSDIRVLEDGTVLTRPSGNHMWDSPKIYDENYIEEFCIDGFLDSDQMNKTDGPVEFIRSPQNQIVLFCHQSRLEFAEDDNDIIYSWLFFLLFSFSSFVLAVIVLLYGLLWRKQNLHGWTILGFCGSMSLWFFFSAVTHGAGLFQGYSWSLHMGGTTCILNGILWHFFYVATFSWMAVLNFDLWSATCAQSIPGVKRTTSFKHKLGLYCCAGFGPPVLVVTIALIIEHQFDIFDDRVVRPLYGYDICCLDRTALLYYASSVSFIFFGLNLFFAWSTMVFLCKYKKTIQVDSAIANDVSQFSKLFMLMGFTWIFEMASWNEELTWYLAVFDVYNIIQAVGLFWIFVCRREIWEQLLDTYPILRATCRCLKIPESKTKGGIEETENDSLGCSQGLKVASITTVTNYLSCMDTELPSSKTDAEANRVEFELTTRY